MRPTLPCHLSTSRAAARAASLLACLLLATGAFAGGEEEGGGAAAPPLPPEIWGDLDPNATPQSLEDLRRTRERLYGFDLDEAQHQRIGSWRVHDRSWWLDSTRNQDAAAAQLELKDLLQSPSAASVRGLVEADERLFGVDTEARTVVVGGGGGGGAEEGGESSPAVTETYLEIRYEARLRPDLFTIEQGVLAVARHAVEVIEPLGVETQKDYLGSLGIAGNPANFFSPTTQLLADIEVERAARLEAWYASQHSLYLAGQGAGYDVVAQRFTDSEARRLALQTERSEVQSYLQQLPTSIREPLLDHVVENVMPALVTVVSGATPEREARWVATLEWIYQNAGQ